jgi:Flp pilus assembly protein TadB
LTLCAIARSSSHATGGTSTCTRDIFICCIMVVVVIVVVDVIMIIVSVWVCSVCVSICIFFVPSWSVSSAPSALKRQ